MPWTYIQSTGELKRPNGTVASTGYAGYGPGRNNPAMQGVKNIGPVPRGKYHMGYGEDHPKTGRLTIRLVPDPSNQMFGRSGFLIHGDNKTGTASHGCIIAGFNARVEVDKSPDRYLEVIAAPAAPGVQS